MTVSTFSEASRATTNTGYNAVFIEDRSVYFSWLLKTDEYPDQTYTVTLDGVDYDIRLRGNIVTGKQIGRASCRERVSSPV